MKKAPYRTHLEYPPLTMYQMIERIAHQYPNEPAYELYGRKTTYAGFVRREGNDILPEYFQKQGNLHPRPVCGTGGAGRRAGRSSRHRADRAHAGRASGPPRGTLHAESRQKISEISQYKSRDALEDISEEGRPAGST